MRIIAGSCKGRRLFSPRWVGLRPTSDRLRETLFDILGDQVVGKRVLDACAGTGALGIEALSRGAIHAIFVDRDPRAVDLIRQNIVKCKLSDRCSIIRGTLPRVLGRLRISGFDLILLDPPYAADDTDAILSAVADHLEDEGLLVLERSRKQEQISTQKLVAVRSVCVGSRVLEFFTPQPRA